ncbi:hypothetical protein CKO31_06590 [Thiohalocapsa halophila]|uniref:Hemin transport protein n=1 Tax=Thiohalocapsa halophila TaxID=69359 RepID=A0ABS1CEU5_9GAMM|nr:hypothetical protein [Thiohalocapsa halophila]MBK1630419.1 hypothetical protein [Thiohalocapsa halophila]
MSVTTLRPAPKHQRRSHAPPASATTPSPGLPARTPLHHAAAGLRLSGHWPELLCDLALLGDLRLELATTRVRLLDRVSLAGLRVDGPFASLHGTDQSLRLLLARCHALSAAPARDALLLEDDLGRPLLRLRPDAGRDARLWRLVMGGILGNAERVVPLQQTPPALAPLASHPLAALQALCADDPDAPGFADTAELTGQLALDPGRLRHAAAAAVAVDPALIPCALRALCEELLPIAITTGSDALALRRRAAFHAYDYALGRARLSGDATRFELDVAAIDSAWVVGSDAGATGGRQLRLYDADSRALAVIAAAPASAACRSDAAVAPCGGEPRFWRSLMNALTS